MKCFLLREKMISVHHLHMDKMYPVFRIGKLRQCRLKRYLQWIWESECVWGKYILPIDDFFVKKRSFRLVTVVFI